MRTISGWAGVLLLFATAAGLALPARAQRGSGGPPPPGQGPGGFGPGGQDETPPPPPPRNMNPPNGGAPGRGAIGPAAPVSAALRVPQGRWWNDAATAQNLGLSADQIRRMDAIFNGARDRLIDLDAAVQKASAGLEPLLEAEPLDRSRVMAQLGRLSQAKADLEKANAQMLLDLRLQLTHEQWLKLQSERPPMGRGGGGTVPNPAQDPDP